MFCSVGIQALGCCVAIQRALVLPAWRHLMILNNYEAMIIDAIALLNNCERFAILVFLNRMMQSFKTCLLILECACFMVSYANFSLTHARAHTHTHTHTHTFCRFSISLIPADSPFSNANGSVCVCMWPGDVSIFVVWAHSLFVRLCVCVCVCWPVSNVLWQWRQIWFSRGLDVG